MRTPRLLIWPKKSSLHCLIGTSMINKFGCCISNFTSLWRLLTIKSQINMKMCVLIPFLFTLSHRDIYYYHAGIYNLLIPPSTFIPKFTLHCYSTLHVYWILLHFPPSTAIPPSSSIRQLRVVFWPSAYRFRFRGGKIKIFLGVSYV